MCIVVLVLYFECHSSYITVFSGACHTIDTWATAAQKRLSSAFRPGTMRTYNRVFRDFLAFLILANICNSQVNALVILSFLEYLYQNQVSPAQIAIHVSALKSMFSIHTMDTRAFQDRRIELYLRALRINKPYKAQIAPIISIDMLYQILLTCDNLPHPEIYRALYTLAFFSFLRTSNILPHATNQFDATRHLARGDLIFHSPGAIIVLKWTKTLQARNTVKLISIPQLGLSTLCPIQAMRKMIALHPANNNSPLFTNNNSHSSMILTDSMVRKHLNKILQIIKCQTLNITFHSFRRSGATWAFNHNVPLAQIQSQGTWSSDCVWNYINRDSDATDILSSTFQNYLLQ